jgi:Tol biopolymer transport system component
MMHRFLLCLLIVAACPSCVTAQPTPKPFTPKLLIAFASVRERRAPPYPRIFFYEHDGVAQGRLVGSVESVTQGDQKTRSDMHPSLSRDGRYCAFSAQMGPTSGAHIEIWDRTEKKRLPLLLNSGADVHRMTPSLTRDGKRVAYSAWAQPGGTPRWGVYLYDLTAKKLVDLPRLNGETTDQRQCALSADGRFLAYVSHGRGGVGLTDVWMYDLKKKQVLALREMNSKNTDMQPSLSGDGRLIAFTSNRPGGKGGRDIYLYDRVKKAFLTLPGLNSVAHDQSPSLSADGRYLAFVSERFGGAGERDVYLYDRETQKVLPTPGLNSKDDDYDPCVIVLPGRKEG